MDLRQEMAGHWSIECLCHASDLHPLRHTAHAKQIDHGDVDRVMGKRLPMWLYSIKIFARAYRRRQSIGYLGESLVVVTSSGIFQPPQAKFLDATTNGNSLVHTPALINIHQ
jgi:hypothetical protein